jgi:hypothetical protein
VKFIKKVFGEKLNGFFRLILKTAFIRLRVNKRYNKQLNLLHNIKDKVDLKTTRNIYKFRFSDQTGKL